MAKKQKVTINLHCYTIRFREKLKIDQWLPIKQIFPRKKFEDIIGDFVKGIDTQTYISDSRERILYLQESISSSATYYGAVVRRGYNGQESYIDEITSSKANTVGSITVNQFNSSPFYMGIYLPNIDSKRMILLVQSYKQYGFKELFEEAFKAFFKASTDNTFICEINSLSISKLFEMYLNDGSIRKIRFKKHALPANMENLLGGQDDQENRSYEVEVSIKAKHKGFTSIKKRLQDAEFIEVFNDNDFEYDELLADISIGNRKRVINVMDPSTFAASFDITETSKINPDTGLPNFRDIHKEAKSILKDEILPFIDSE